MSESDSRSTEETAKTEAAAETSEATSETPQDSETSQDKESQQDRATGVISGIRRGGRAISGAIPRGRGLVRSVVLGVGLIALVGVSVLVGRLTGSQQPAAAQEEAQAAPADAAEAAGDATGAAAAGGEHGHGGQGDRNPYMIVPENIEPWSTSATYTAADGTPFTLHVELEKPTSDGMGMCTAGPSAANYSRMVVLSVRNDGDAAATAPQFAVKDKRIAFPHADGMGCSWVYPRDVDSEYAPGDAKTFRGLIVTKPADEDVILSVLPEFTEEVLRIPTSAFVDA